MRIGSLFSGYGGLDLGVQAVLGGEVAWHVEYDKAPSRILAHHYPDIPNLGDVTTVDFTAVEPVDVLTGGYPCQPFSHAGKRKGTDDERHLWPHVLRALREMGPRLAVLENVRGHLSLGFDVVLADLADLGWFATWGVVRASDAGAPHGRPRIFLVAYPSGTNWRAAKPKHLVAPLWRAAKSRERYSATSWGPYSDAIARWEAICGRSAPSAFTDQLISPRFVEWMMGLPDGWVTDPAIGISRNDQLKALGNGVVPQQAALALSLLRDHVGAVAA